MKFTSMITLATLLASTNAYANTQKQGQFFLNFGAATNYYRYENEDARDELKPHLENLLDDYDLTGDDTDYLNTSLGLGYYINNNLAVRANYTTGIELDWLDLCFFDCKDNVFHESDASILTLDTIYHFHHFNEAISVYGLLGLAVTRVSTKLSYRNTEDRNIIANEHTTNYGANIGLGLQYDFAKNWAVKAGYSHHTFLSMDKIYANLEWRF